MYTRYSKIILVLALSLFAFLVVFNNLNDYNSNFMYVTHVLSMDTTFPGNNGMWRAITSPLLHHAVYNFIILVEIAIAILCGIGSINLLKSVANVELFNRAKGVAILGLTLGILLWFAGFFTIGGEWFLMWQSKDWNGQQAAFRLAVVYFATLLYLVQPDREYEP